MRVNEQNVKNGKNNSSKSNSKNGGGSKATSVSDIKPMKAEIHKLREENENLVKMDPDIQDGNLITLISDLKNEILKLNIKDVVAATKIENIFTKIDDIVSQPTTGKAPKNKDQPDSNSNDSIGSNDMENKLDNDQSPIKISISTEKTDIDRLIPVCEKEDCKSWTKTLKCVQYKGFNYSGGYTCAQCANFIESPISYHCTKCAPQNFLSERRFIGSKMQNICLSCYSTLQTLKSSLTMSGILSFDCNVLFFRAINKDKHNDKIVSRLWSDFCNSNHGYALLSQQNKKPYSIKALTMGLKSEITVNKFVSHCLFWQNYCSIKINLFENKIKPMLANNNKNNNNDNEISQMNLYDKFTFNRNQIGLFPNNVLFGNFSQFLSISNALATSNNSSNINTLKRDISTDSNALFFILHNGIFTFFSKELNSAQLRKATIAITSANVVKASYCHVMGQNSYRIGIVVTIINFSNENCLVLMVTGVIKCNTIINKTKWHICAKN